MWRKRKIKKEGNEMKGMRGGERERERGSDQNIRKNEMRWRAWEGGRERERVIKILKSTSQGERDSASKAYIEAYWLLFQTSEHQNKLLKVQLMVILGMENAQCKLQLKTRKLKFCHGVYLHNFQVSFQAI